MIQNVWERTLPSLLCLVFQSHLNCFLRVWRPLLKVGGKFSTYSFFQFLPPSRVEIGSGNVRVLVAIEGTGWFDEEEASRVTESSSSVVLALLAMMRKLGEGGERLERLVVGMEWWVGDEISPLKHLFSSNRSIRPSFTIIKTFNLHLLILVASDHRETELTWPCSFSFSLSGSSFLYLYPLKEDLFAILIPNFFKVISLFIASVFVFSLNSLVPQLHLWIECFSSWSLTLSPDESGLVLGIDLDKVWAAVESWMINSTSGYASDLKGWWSWL